MKWKTVQSTVEPEEIDYTSSSSTVYLHRNIEASVTTEDDTSTTTYTYEEAKLSPTQFAAYMEGKKAGDNSILMEAIADLYDIIAEMSTSTEAE